MNKQLTSEQQVKVNAALDVVNNSVLYGIYADIAFVRSILPDHYEVNESKKRGSIHCKSEIGFRKPPYEDEGGRLITDAENEIAWASFKCTLKANFADRLQEIFHNTCFCHVDFTIYLKERTGV